MRIKQHPSTGLWVREDGAVCIPPDGYKFKKFRWTFGSKNGDGYMRVRFRGKDYNVHRLVAETYLDNPNGYKEVDHFPDRNPANNAVSNLRWADRKMQNNNRQVCKDSLEKYGVRSCDDSAGYMRALRSKNPEFAERERAKRREYRAKQRELGRHYRVLPNGKRKYLTDEEFNNLYKDGLK